VTAVLESMRQHRIGALSPLHLEWPTQVAALCRAAPLILFTRGDVSTLQRPSIALTGSVTPTAFGIHLALELGTGLADLGWGIAAGTGGGIDDLALKAARAMNVRTITVAAACVDDTIPEIGIGGVLVSELPPTAIVTVGGQRRAKHLLAALAAKTILLEASNSSGALRTAETAHALGRPVGVVPGPEVSLSTAGCRDIAARHGLPFVMSIVDADRLR